MMTWYAWSVAAVLVGAADATVPTVQVDPWGHNSVRIRWVLDGGAILTGLPGALEDAAPAGTATRAAPASEGSGPGPPSNIKATVSPAGLVTVTRVSSDPLYGAT